MVCDQRLFKRGAAEICRKVSFFCENFRGGQHAAKTALKQKVFCLSVELMIARAAELKALLGWSKDELNQRVNADPLMLARKPSTVAHNIRKLQAHSFSHIQALDMYASNPSMAGYDWGAPSNIEKLMFLCVPHLSVNLDHEASSFIFPRVSVLTCLLYHPGFLAGLRRALMLSLPPSSTMS